MKSLLSPKELAAAIGVSESTVKRWVDDGIITATKTVGGHRRISLPDAVKYIRQSQPEHLQPAALGIDDLSSRGILPQQLDATVFFEALKIGDAPRVRGLVMAAYLSGQTISRICDEPIAQAMHQMGELWKHDPSGIFFEHRAVDLCIQALTQLRMVLPRAANDSPTAVGGGGPGDPYLLPTLMATTVLSDIGYQDVNLGPNTPIATFIESLRRVKPKLVWMSISSIEFPNKLNDQFPQLIEATEKIGARIVIGGRASEQLQIIGKPNVLRFTKIAEFDAFARGLFTAKG